MKQLPIGIQDFEKIISGNYLYVDKTEEYFKAFEEGTHFFLSRPRRFGKSLLLSTLKYLYQGRKDLFKGLWIEDKWDWEQKYPVIYIDLNKINTQTISLTDGLNEQIASIAKDYNIILERTDYIGRFSELMARLSATGQKCVVLVDEYDKPITDYINQPEVSQKHIRELKGFYGQLKSSDSNTEKVILTGVSKYGKVAIFSDLNNLNDITLSPDHNCICGYTQKDLEYYFKPYFPKLMAAYQLTETELLKWIKTWYNGYSWNGVAEESMYNPFSILNLFWHARFNNFWFETGTPTFLTDLLKKEKIHPEVLERLTSNETIFSSSDLWNLDVISLLAQTGYLTVKTVKLSPIQTRYTLAYPNQEVRLAFTNFLLAAYMEETPARVHTEIIIFLQDALYERNWEDFFKIVNRVFASVPYSIFETTESYYHSMVHVMFTLTGHSVLSEVLTSKGRIDTVLETDDFVAIFEFKLDSTPEIALAQIHEKRYAERYEERYEKPDKALILIGVNFDSNERRITNYLVVSPES